MGLIERVTDDLVTPGARVVSPGASEPWLFGTFGPRT